MNPPCPIGTYLDSLRASSPSKPSELSTRLRGQIAELVNIKEAWKASPPMVRLCEKHIASITELADAAEKLEAFAAMRDAGHDNLRKQLNRANGEIKQLTFLLSQLGLEVIKHL